MKTRRITVVIGAAALILAIGGAAGCSSHTTATSSGNAAIPGSTSANSAAATSATDSAKNSSSSNSSQLLPVAQNPIQNTSTKAGLEITQAMAENNIDPVTKKDLSDRIQFTVKNTSSETLSDLEVYYSMTDTTTKKSEGYYQKLTGFTLAPGAEGTVFFDNQTGPGHYPENKYSLYRTSPNEVLIDIEVSAPGYKPALGQAVKAVGTGENAAD